MLDNTSLYCSSFRQKQKMRLLRNCSYDCSALEKYTTVTTGSQKILLSRATLHCFVTSNLENKQKIGKVVEMRVPYGYNPVYP